MNQNSDHDQQSAGWDAIRVELGLHLVSLEGLLGHVTPANYGSPNTDDKGTLGKQIRHLLDRVAALLSADATIDYDNRKRGTPVEYDIECARNTFAEYRKELESFEMPTGDLHVRHWLNDDESVELPTSWMREISYVVCHTVHHMAIVRLHVEEQGIKLPEAFGVASSTLRYLQGEASCAR